MENEFPGEARDSESISDFLTTFLHTLGIALYYKELQGFERIVLNPMWIADAVYELVNHLKSNSKSRITESEIKSLLTDGGRGENRFAYTDKDARYIYRLMLEYELAYEYQDGTLIIPLYMPDDEPAENEPPFPYGETLSVKFCALNSEENLEHMPEEVIPRLIVAVHNNIYQSNNTPLAWRKSVVLKKGSAIAKAVKTEDNTITLSSVDRNGG